MMGFRSSGSFSNLERFFRRVQSGDLFSDLEKLGQQGVDALASATPYDSGETSQSWAYRVFKSKGSIGIAWYNTHTSDGANVAILLQYGHATGTGGYVQGHDFINPAIRPIFDKISNNVWKKVNK